MLRPSLEGAGQKRKGQGSQMRPGSEAGRVLRAPCVATPEAALQAQYPGQRSLAPQSVSEDSQSFSAVPGAKLGKIDPGPNVMKQETRQETWVALWRRVWGFLAG